MNEPGPVTSGERELTRPVFISYATADRKEALAVCKAIERRKTSCWISSRDVRPGDNYQEAIVRAIRNARAMVLVFSDAANNSDEIKKELSLASKHRLPVMALRIEDVEPSDAFAYELSTRQWIDAFENWDRSVDALVRHINQISASDAAAPAQQATTAHRRATPTARRDIFVAVAAALVLAIAAGGWWLLRPSPAAAHSMMVRLTGFSNLSSDLPAGVPGAMRDEIIAAFNDDGVVGVSTAAAPPPGTAPAYALGGTIRREADKIKVNVRLTDERSGATLWSNMFSYDSGELPRVPRHIAVDAGNMLRCGLFGASTYRKTLSDSVLADYMQSCHNSGLIDYEPGKMLDSANKVVAAAPDFSWGWAAVSEGAFGLALQNPDSPRAADYRKQALDAADKAIALDKSNSEALDDKGAMQNPSDFAAQEALFKQALAARPLACGCEHHLYGGFLQSVGRNNEAIDEFRRSTDVLALDFDSQFSLASSLLMAGRSDEAKSHFDAAADLLPNGLGARQIELSKALLVADYPAALKATQSADMQMPAETKAALGTALQAIVSRDPAAKSRAVQMLMALPPDVQGSRATALLAGLGANSEAMRVIDAHVARYTPATSWLFMPPTRGLLDDPAFPAFARKIGLMRYWKSSHTKPDVCSANNAPAFCRMI